MAKLKASAQALENFFDFWFGHLDASQLQSYYIIHGSDGYAQVAAHIDGGLRARGLHGTLLHFEEQAAEVRTIGLTQRHNPGSVACLTYLLDYGRVARDAVYRENVKNLGVFDYWDIERVRLVADVPIPLFSPAFSQSREDLKRRAASLLGHLKKSETVTVTTQYGTEIVAVPQREPVAWYENIGNPIDHMLPVGELSARPTTVDGRVNFTGTLLGTIPFGFKYGSIRPGELTLEFRKGQLTQIGGARTALVRDLEQVITRLPAITKVGETSISINTGIPELAGIGYQWEERYPGFHFALGAELPQNLTKITERVCPHHIDFIFDNCTIYAGDTPIFKDRTFIT